MNQDFIDPIQAAIAASGAATATLDRVPVIALHCSGADGGQWRKLGTAVGPGFTVLTPNLIGSGDAGPWHGAHAFTLADEAAPIIAMIDAAVGPVHLVGHSYGAAVALKVACARPTRIASLSLYEPIPFQILRQLGACADRELVEIEGLAVMVTSGLLTGAYRAAAATFVNYWGGPGTWDALREDIRAGLARWLGQAPLDFRALLNDDTTLAQYEKIGCPMLIMRGAHGRAPSKLLADKLVRAAPLGVLEVLPGAGHMGPVTHAADVIARFAAHIQRAAAGQGPDISAMAA